MIKQYYIGQGKVLTQILLETPISIGARTETERTLSQYRVVMMGVRTHILPVLHSLPGEKAASGTSAGTLTDCL